MSHFQLLPFDVVECIVKYSLTTRTSWNSWNKLTSLALMHSCHHWRYVFIEAAFDSLSLSSGSDTPYLYLPRCGRWINPFHYPLNRLVKSLEISFAAWGYILSGKVNAWIKSSGLAEIRLNRLDSFVLKVGDTHSSYHPMITYNSTTAQEVVSFFQLLRQIMPSVRKIEIERAAIKWPVGDSAINLLAENQVLHLLRSVNTIKFNCRGLSTYLKHSNMFANGNLTSLTYSHYTNIDTISFLEMLRLNAANLVSANIDNLPLTYVKNIIKSDDGEPLVYIFLNYLKLTNLRRVNAESPLSSDELTDVSPDIVHFPALKTLDLSRGLYPFNGNILASGLNNTLEELNLPFITPNTLEDPVQSILSTQLVNLKKITLVSYMFRHHNPPIAAAGSHQYNNIHRFLRMLLQSAVCLSKFEIKMPVDSFVYFDEPLCFEFNSLRLLHFSGCIFNFSDVLYILQRAPYLRRLTCELDDSPPKIEGISPIRLPRHMEDLSPINSSFYELRVQWRTRKVAKCHMRSAVLLAIGCPNFSIIDFRNLHRNEPQDIIKKILTKRTFQKYADAGKRLLDKMDYIYEIRSFRDNWDLF